MPRPKRTESSLDTRRLAFIGAQARLSELEAERQAILRAFPQLSRSVVNRTTEGSVSTDSRPRRRRRKMSAEGRRRIAEASKRRWAEWRKQNRRE